MDGRVLQVIWLQRTVVYGKMLMGMSPPLLDNSDERCQRPSGRLICLHPERRC